MDVGGVTPPDGLSTLLKGLKFGSTPAGQEELVQLYLELKECYEAQERAAPAEYAGDQDEDVKQACTQASLFFIARVLIKQRQNPGEQRSDNLGYPISRIVAAAGINLLDFFREVHVVVSKLSAYFEARGSSSKLFSQWAHLKENSELVVVMGLLAKKYKDNFNTFLHQLDSYKQLVLRLGWNAFLLLRVKLLSAFPDVVSCMELLPCIFAILASHAPRLPDCLSHVSRENRSPLMLQKMSEICKADAGRVQARMSAVQPLLIQILTTAVPEWRLLVAAAKSEAVVPGEPGVAPPAAVAPGGLDLVASPVLKGLVTDTACIDRVVAALEREYEQHYARGGSELDERAFLTTDFAKFASPRFSPRQMHSVMARMRGMPMPLRPGALLGPGAHTTGPIHMAAGHGMGMRTDLPPGLHSPLPMMHLGVGGQQPGTPVSEAMVASAWLRAVTANMVAEPSAILQRFLAAVPLSGPSAGFTLAAAPSAPPSAVLQLSRRVRDMVASVIPEETVPSLLGPFPLLQPSVTSERRVEAVKLYYHSLETILLGEEKTSGMAGVTALLSSSKFHRGLIACCIEVVAACYRMVVCSFPKVLDVLRIKAFDLHKMIQTFVKSMDSLPRELKRHLFQIEEKVIEALAWEPGSSLYHLLLTAHNEAAATAAAAQDAARPPASGGAPSGEDGGSGTKPSEALARTGSEAGEAAEGAEKAAVIGATATQAAGAVPGADGAAAAEPRAAGAPSAGGQPSAPAGAPPPSPKRGQAAAFSGLMSPVKKARGVDGAALVTLSFNEPLPPSVGPLIASGTLQPGSSAAALYEFCRKVLKLSSFRLSMICENFDFAPLTRHEVQTKVYETVEHALLQQTHLFYNRHIDQVMLSALYGYCKVHKLQQVSFREIITQYRKQPQSQQAIFRSVVIEQSNPGLQITSRADIIAFYNQVFVPAMKAFLLKADAAAAAAAAPVPSSVEPKPATAVPFGTPDDTAAPALPAATPVFPMPAPGLPPLAPRSASHSPRAPKASSMPTAPTRLSGRTAAGAGLGRQPAGLDSDKAAGSETVCKMEQDSVAGEDMSRMQQPADITSTGTSSMGLGSVTRTSPSAASTVKASGPRGRAADHKIPDCLAVLLQALDSQQNEDSDNDDPDEKDDEDALPAAPSGPTTRSGRSAALAAGGSAIKGSRERSLGHERRSTRLADRSRDVDAMDTDGPREDEPSSPTGVVTGRRHRTPSRRYGSA